ncbi:MAG: DUF6370 family protein [Nannocystaceae bacterium]
MAIRLDRPPRWSLFLLLAQLGACTPSASAPEPKAAPAATEANRLAQADAASRQFKGDTIKVACGSCVFKMEGAKGCPWAAEIDGEHYLIEGRAPADGEHDSHADDGMCKVAREAVVTGELRADKLVVTQMDLLPLHPTK